MAAVNMNALRYWYAQQVAESLPDGRETHDRAGRALGSLRTLFEQSQEAGGEVDPVLWVKEQLEALPEPASALPYLVELWAAPAFAPHDLKVPHGARVQAMEHLLDFLRLPLQASDLDEYWRAAERAYSDSGRVGVVARVAGATLLTGAALFTGSLAVITGGLSLAPSAAAMTAALAALGGGAVATGGFGMVGGIAVLMLGSAAGGGLALYTQQALQQLGAAGLRTELTKLEVTQRLWWRMRSPSAPTRAQVAAQQEQLLCRLRALLETEKSISDPRSAPIKQWETMIKLVEQSQKRLSETGM